MDLWTEGLFSEDKSINPISDNGEKIGVRWWIAIFFASTAKHSSFDNISIIDVAKTLEEDLSKFLTK